MSGVEGEMGEAFERFGRVGVEFDLGDEVVVCSGKSGRKRGDGFDQGSRGLC
jgi:hypothetical protein